MHYISLAAAPGAIVVVPESKDIFLANGTLCTNRQIGEVAYSWPPCKASVIFKGNDMIN